MEAVLYIHGKGGSAGESERYSPLFPGKAVVGLDYRSDLPWETGEEIHTAAEALRESHGGVILIANSIGAYFSLHARLDGLLQRAFFISPIVDMEGLIVDMLRREKVGEAELRSRGSVPTAFGETLSWDYLCFVRSHPVVWNTPTDILYGSRDALTSFETVSAFARRHQARLTVMEGGEHWFHSPEQLRFLDDWLMNCGKSEAYKTVT